MPPGKGMISLFIAATVGKRTDSAAQARSAWAGFWNAPSWITLPAGPAGFGAGAGSAGSGSLVSLGGSFLGAAGLGRRDRRLGALLMSSWASLSSPALVSNAVSLSPATSSPPGLGGLTLYGPGRRLDQLGRAAHLRVAAADPEKCRRDQRRGEQDHQQRREHLARRHPARLVLILDRLQPRQLALIVALIAHRAISWPAAFRPMTTQPCPIMRMRWHSTVEWACEVVPICSR